MKFESLIEMPTAWSVVAQRFGVHLFEGRVTVAEMDRMQAVGDQWYRKRPGKLVELVVIYPSDTRMTQEERTRMSQLIKRWEDERTASATVILAEGIIGSMQRSILTGLMMMAPAPHPAKVFATVSDAVRFLAPHVKALSGADATTEALLSAVGALCRAFEARPLRARTSP